MEAKLNTAIDTLRRYVALRSSDDVCIIELAAPTIGICGNCIQALINHGRWELIIVKNGYGAGTRSVDEMNGQLLLSEFVRAFGSLNNLKEVNLVLDGEVEKIF